MEFINAVNYAMKELVMNVIFNKLSLVIVESKKNKCYVDKYLHVNKNVKKNFHVVFMNAKINAIQKIVNNVLHLCR